MRVCDLMTKDVKSCGASDTLERAAQLMWDYDCGCVPVVDTTGHLIGIITDRDICMAAYTQGLPLSQLRVWSIASKIILAARETDSVKDAERLMRHGQVHHLPVLDPEGRLTGILSLSDLARYVHHLGGKADGLSSESITDTMATIAEPRARPAKHVRESRAHSPSA